MNHTYRANWGSIAVTINPLSLIDRLFLAASLAAVLVLSFPHLAVADTTQGLPMAFPVDYPVLLSVSRPDFPLGEDVIPLDKVKTLREYLESKNSPMTEHAEALLTQKHYVYIVAIAFAESNFCKKNIRAYNCWGIGGGNPLTYRNYAEAFAYASGLVEKYRDAGMTSPELMRNTWVGWQNDNWTVAVNMVISDLHNLGL